jgi:hypothetical protein
MIAERARTRQTSRTCRRYRDVPTWQDARRLQAGHCELLAVHSDRRTRTGSLPLHPGATRVEHHRLLIFPERRRGEGSEVHRIGWSSGPLLHESFEYRNPVTSGRLPISQVRNGPGTVTPRPLSNSWAVTRLTYHSRPMNRQGISIPEDHQPLTRPLFRSGENTRRFQE